MEKVKVKKLNENATLPYKAHETDAGYDLFSIMEEAIAPSETKLY